MNGKVSPERLDRVLGSVTGAAPGPLCVVVGGIHGNEPAGVLAARAVLAALAERSQALRGRVVALCGNLAALRTGTRYVDRDLNRVWTAKAIAALRSGEPALDSEAREQVELLEVLEGLLGEAGERVVLLDLHSTSADGAPFTIMSDTLQNRAVAFELPIPVILGLEERIDGTLLSFFGEAGHVAFCVEGGQNQAAATVAHHESAIWITLEAAGLLPARAVPDRDEHRRRLRAAARALPAVVELRYRQPIEPGEAFRMEPGFENFDAVERGRLMAHGGSGGDEPIHAPSGGLLLMPRYQGQGDDGFFLGERVGRFWLVLSAVLRRLRLDRLVHLFPGCRRDPARPGVIRADPRVARWMQVEILHLFGFRRARAEADAVVFVRRPDRL